jgi:hypothetical protein
MPVSDEKVAFVLVLQLDPILEGAMVISQVQLARGPHAREHAPILNGAAHAAESISALMK